MFFIEWITNFSDISMSMYIEWLLRMAELVFSVFLSYFIFALILGIFSSLFRHAIPRFLSTGTDEERTHRTQAVLAGISRLLVTYKWLIWIWFIVLAVMFESGLWIDISQNHFWFSVFLRLSRIFLILMFMEITITSVNYGVDKWVESVGDNDPTFSDAEKRAFTISFLLKSTARYVFYFVGFVMIIKEFGVEIGPILAGAGVVGLAVGFGAQTLVKDIISGFFILFEDQFHVGDYIKVGDVQGVVEKMALRITVVRSYDGALHIFPNSALTPVTLLSRDYSRAIVDVGVTYEEDIDKLNVILNEIASEFKHPDILEPVLVMGVQNLGDFDVTFRLAVRTSPLAHWSVERELRQAVKKGLDQRNIEIPFQQQVVHYIPQVDNKPEEEKT